MQNNPLLIIVIVAIIALALGTLIGYFIFSVFEGRLSKALEDAREFVNADDPIHEKPEKIESTVHEHEVLKVTIDPALKWHLELDGVRIEPDGLTAEQRTRLVNVVVQIRPWIDSKAAPAPAPAPAPLAPPPAPEPMPSSLTLSSPLQPVKHPVVPSTPAGRMDPIRGFRSLLESDVKKPEPLLKSPNIVAMIDEVLQQKLVGHPLAAKKIRLEEGPSGEVVVFLGATRYDGIDSVPDEAIQALIREAIKEWNDQ